MPQIAKCSTCKAPVIFVPSITTGRSMILDAEPNPAGNTVIIDGKGKVDAGDMFDVVPAGLPRYMSHWATCVDAKLHRERQKDKKNKGMK